jgi:hypothetical protein
MKKEEYTLVVRNINGDLLRTFEQNQFDEIVKYIERTNAVDVSCYRVQFVRKGPER